MKKTILAICLLALSSVFAYSQLATNQSEFINEWQKTGENWTEARDIELDLFANNWKLAEGKGVNYVSVKKSSGSVLTSKKSFGDVKLEFDFLAAGDTKASLVLANGFEINLGKGSPFAAIQGLGVPDQDVSRAPGLWQHVSLIYTRATKEMPSVLEYLKINEQVVYQYIISQDKAGQPEPLKFVVNQGLFALKNVSAIDYARNQPISATNFSYSLQETLSWDRSYEPTKTKPVTGTLESLTTQFSNEYKEYEIVFKGDLKVDKTDLYTFTLDYAGAAMLTIDGKPTAGSSSPAYRVPTSGAVQLSAGIHPFEFKFKRMGWQPAFGIFVSSSTFRPYGLHDPKTLPAKTMAEAVYLEPDNERAKLVKSFMLFEDGKRTAVMSVGSKTQRHFSFDTDAAALLYAWKGHFADVTDLWFERGEPQIILPRGLQVQFSGKCPFVLKTDQESDNNMLTLEEYYLDKEGLPTFNFKYKGNFVSQKIIPENDAIRVEVAAENEKLNYVLAASKSLTKVGETLYKVGEYFVKLPVGVTANITENNGMKSLVADLNALKSYTIIW